MKPTGFNQEVFIDLKECRDHNRTRYHVLSMVDAASSYHLATVVKEKTSRYVARKFLKKWIRVFGILVTSPTTKEESLRAGSHNYLRSTAFTAESLRPTQAGS
jgi:hypothetical protein